MTNELTLLEHLQRAEWQLEQDTKWIAELKAKIEAEEMAWQLHEEQIESLSEEDSLSFYSTH